MTNSLRVLLLEDSEADAALILLELVRGGIPYLAERVDTKAAFERCLASFAPDVVLCDHSLAQFNAPAALAIVRGRRPATPLIVVSGGLDSAAAVACMRAGAEDIIMKSDLSKLAAAIITAVAIRERFSALSPRQREVMRLIAEGLSTREVGEQLGMSTQTADTHRTEVMKRLGLHDVVSLVKYAVRLGLVRSNGGQL
jgi:DNA-binding NarL/FixJ family response regulator